MTEVRDLSCPLMTKVLLHTYNKNRAPVQGADGKLSASKLKNTGTAKALAIRYGLIVQPQFLKNNVVRSAARVQEVGGSSPCRCTMIFFFAHSCAYAVAVPVAVLCVRCCVSLRQRELTNRCNEAAWQEEDKEYDSDSMKNALMSRYPTAIPGSVRINAKGGSATVLGAPAAPSSVVSAGDLHIGRQLQLIHGALIDIGADLRLLSGRATAGSRGKVSAAASFLLNGTAEEDESGQLRG